MRLDDGSSDLIGYVSDVEPCAVTERELLHAERPHPPEGERKPSKAEQVEALIRDRCRDGEPHPSMYDELRERWATRYTHHRQGPRKKLCTNGARPPGSMNGGWLWTLRLRARSAKTMCMTCATCSRARGGALRRGCVPVYLTP